MSDRALTRHRGRLTISRRKAGSGYDENSHAHQVYMSALRCCAWPILAASKEPVRTPLSNPGGSHGGLGGLAGGVSSLSSLSGLVEAREESFVQGNTVILSPQAVNAFKVKVPERATFLKMVTKEREQIFAKSAFNLYNRLLSTPTFNPRMIGDLSTLIELIGAYIDRELTNLPPEQHDDLLLQVMSLYISIVKESLQRADPKVSKAVLNHPLLGDGFKPLLSKFMKNIKEIKGDNTGTSLTDWLRVIFNVPKVDHDRFVAKAKQTMNERVAFGDLTIFLDQLSRDRVPSASPDDFRGGQEYQTYKQTEAGVLSGLINALKLRYPDIARHTTNMPNSISLLPQRPDDFYRYLLNKCLEHDLQNSGEELTLSKLSNQVLSECALRWRLPRHFRELAKLDIVVRNYINKTIPIDDVFPTFKVVRKLAEDSRSFRKVDTSYYVSILDSLQAVLHKYLVHFADQLNHPSTAMYSNTTMQLSTHILSEIWTDRAWSESNPSKMGKLEDQIREELLEAMTARYQLLNNRVYTARVEREIQKMTLLVKAINIEVNKYQQHYPDPILGSIYLKPIAAETCLKYFILEMENLRYGSLMGDYEIREILELYQVVRLLYDMCEETQLAIVKDFDVESWFAPFIRQWLNLTDQKWLEWVDSAVMQEKYTPTLPPKSMFSTSVFDIFQCFHTGLDFIEKLRWRESGKKEKLIRDFIKMMSKALQRYTQLMFEEFEQIENENSDKATEFTYQSCIKLNNLLAAHHKLRDILDKLGVSRNGRIDPDAPRRDMPGDDPELAHSWLFHIKVIRAQNLMACDWTTSDPYVVLKHSGMELARTRVIEKNLNPAWNETFTVALPDSLPENESFLELFVYDKDIIGSDDLCGNASLFMRDRQFEDYLSHDVELTLKPQGKVFVRVTRQGEIDDNDFWVRKAEETVTFALEDMIRIYIDQIGRVARPIIQKVMNQSGSGAISSLFSSFASLTGGSGGSSTTLTDEQVENLIQPILEYLDLNLGLFNEALDPGLSEFLIERYPWLQASQRSGDKDATASGDAAAGAAEATKDAMMASNGNAMSGATPGAPNFVTKMVWQELLKLIHVYLLSFGGSSKEKAKKQRAQNGGANPTTTGDDLPPVTLSESEKRHTVVLDLIVEYLKTLFHCEVDGEHMGFAVEELEDTRYWEVRRTLKHFLVATKA